MAVERKVMQLQVALTVNKIGLLDRMKYVSKSRGDIKRQVSHLRTILLHFCRWWYDSDSITPPSFVFYVHPSFLWPTLSFFSFLQYHPVLKYILLLSPRSLSHYTRIFFTLISSDLFSCPFNNFNNILFSQEYLRMKRSHLNLTFFPLNRYNVLKSRFTSWIRYFQWNR